MTGPSRVRGSGSSWSSSSSGSVPATVCSAEQQGVGEVQQHPGGVLGHHGPVFAGEQPGLLGCAREQVRQPPAQPGQRHVRIGPGLQAVREPAHHGGHHRRLVQQGLTDGGQLLREQAGLRLRVLDVVVRDVVGCVGAGWGQRGQGLEPGELRVAGLGLAGPVRLGLAAAVAVVRASPRALALRQRLPARAMGAAAGFVQVDGHVGRLADCLA